MRFTGLEVPNNRHIISANIVFNADASASGDCTLRISAQAYNHRGQYERLAAVASGFMLGLSPKDIMVTIGEGFGKTLSGIGLVIAFGTVIGIYLEKTGSTQAKFEIEIGE